MRRACLASLVVMLAAPAFAQPVTPIPTAPKHRRVPRPTSPAPDPATAASGSKSGATYAPDPAATTGDVKPVTTHQEGDYGGVTPGETPKSEHPKPKHKPAKGTLSWIGFEAKDGGAQLFFQSIAPFDLTQSVENGVLVVHLGNLTTLGPNTWRAVDTRFFDNPLSRIEAKRVGAARATKTSAAHGAGLEVRISFKNAKDAHEGTIKSAQEADGYYYAYLSFPEGADQKAPTVGEPEK